MAKHHHQPLEQERRELDAWLAQRTDEIIGKSETTLPLFQGLNEIGPAPLKRMTEFIAQAQRTSKERGEANSVLNVFDMRTTGLQLRAAVASQQITTLGQIMLCD
jgi:hypothetical protein